MNGQADDDFTSYNGMLEPLSSYGMSWKVKPCTAKETAPENCKPCSINSAAAAKAEDLCNWVGKRDVFGDCLDILEWKHYRTMCVYDMCAEKDQSNNTPLCVMLAALAQDCKDAGSPVDWQNDATLKNLCAGMFIIIWHLINLHFST